MSEKIRPAPACEQELGQEKKMRVTIIARVLAAFQSGESFTAREALDRFGTMRLPAVVDELKRRGHVITSETVTVACGDGREALVSRYRMEGVA